MTFNKYKCISTYMGKNVRNKIYMYISKERKFVFHFLLKKSIGDWLSPFL